MKAIDRLIDLLPVPVLIGVASVVLGAWFLKEITHETIGTVLQQPRFHALIIVVATLTATYYVVTLVLRNASVLDARKMAILVARFGGDPDDRAQAHVLETAKTYVSRRGAQDRVVVHGLTRQCSDHQDACRRARKETNDATLWGTFYPDKILHLNISRPASDLESRNTISDFPESPQLERVFDGLLSLVAPQPGESGNPWVQLERTGLLERLGLLEERVSRLEETGHPRGKQFEAKIATQRRLLISVGIDNYQNAPRLRFAVKDARDIAQLLPSLWESSMVLTDADATGEGIRRAMKTVAAEALVDDQVWLYFAGMGVKKGEESYILPYDAEPGRLESTALSMREVWQWLEDLPSRQALIIADACGIQGPGLPREGASLSGGGSIDAQQGRVLIAGSRADEFVSESADLEHGIFTAFVLKALGGAADLDGDSIVKLSEFFHYLRSAVVEYSESGGRLGRLPQHPTLYHEQAEDLYLLAVGHKQHQE